MKMIDKIRKYCDGSMSGAEIARLVGCNSSTVYNLAKQHHLPLKKRNIQKKKSSKVQDVLRLSDGVLTSSQIAEKLDLSQKYVQNVLRCHNAPRRERGSACAELSGSYSCGRSIDRDGYVLTSAPKGHPYARMVKGRKTGRIYEHRLVMEDILGRYLLPHEVVDHIDGLRLHNAKDNLRLFSSNAEHLKSTISGQIPSWSLDGIRKQFLTCHQRASSPRIHTYDCMKKLGDARLIQILLAALQLGIDSPYLLGSSHHLQKAGISDLSHPNLKRVLEEIYRTYE